MQAPDSLPMAALNDMHGGGGELLPLSTGAADLISGSQVPNSSPTAASASSDMYGGATSDACAQLNERLAPFRDPSKSFAVRYVAAGRDAHITAQLRVQL